MSQSPLREYLGNGIITSHAGTKISCEFVLSQFPTKRLNLVCTSHDHGSALSLMKENLQAHPLECSFEGSLVDSTTCVKVDSIYLNNLNMSKESDFIFEFYPKTPIRIEYKKMATNTQFEYRVGLTNLLFLGTDWVTRDKARFLNRINLIIQGREISIELIESYDTASKRLKESRGVEVTAHLITRASAIDINQVEEILNDLCTILSFAAGTWVTWIYEDWLSDDHLIATTLIPTKTIPYHRADYVIDTTEGAELKEYIETTYPNYVQVRDTLGMNIVIEYYVQSKSMNIIELKYLIGAIGLECLKSHLPDYFNKKDKTVDLSSFRSSLEALFQDISMPYDPTELDFIKVRDKIVHTGRFPLNINYIEEYDRLVNLYDRTILTILGYRGKPYHNITKKYAKEPVP